MGAQNDRHYTVYIHTTPSGKRYVGITGRNTSQRWHPQHYNTCTAFYSAICKYGWENITSRVVSVGLTIDEAKRAERFLIDKYKTTDRRYGYNILPGGDISDGTTDEVKSKIANIHRGKKRSKETRQKMRDAQERVGRSCKVVCYETGESYRSQSDAERDLGLYRGGIGAVLDNPHRTCGGYHWVKDIDNAMPPPDVLRDRTKRAAVIVETGQVFESATQLARFLNTTTACVINACKGRNRTVAGVHVKYAGEKDPEGLDVGRYDRVRKPVINLETGEVYDSVQQASDRLNIKTELIISVCKGRASSTHGIRFAYAKHNAENSKDSGENPHKRQANAGASVPVQCVETGVVYNSMNHASKETGICRKNIARACKSKNATAGKLHWSIATI